MRLLDKIVLMLLTVVALKPARLLDLDKLHFNSVSLRAPAGDSETLSLEINFERAEGKSILSISPEGQMTVIDEKSEVIFNGKVQQIYFPLELNPGVREKLEAVGIKYVPVTFGTIPEGFFDHAESSTPNGTLALVSEGSVFLHDNNWSRSFEELNLAIAEKFKNFDGHQITNLSVNFNHAVNILSLKYVDKKTKQKYAGTYAYEDNHFKWIGNRKAEKAEMRLKISDKFEPSFNIQNYSFATGSGVNFSVTGMNGQQVAAAADSKVESETSEIEEATPKKTKSNGIAKDYSKYLESFSKNLEQLVLGQPEAVATLVDIEKQNILANGERKNPEVAMFMGLPGTGKDTLVEGYIQARFAIRYQDHNVAVDHHLFRYPVVKEEKDVWTLTGSGTGYKGSSHLSKLNRFLVLHSGGRYQIKKDGESEFVIENKNWKTGQVLEGYFGPEDGALFINEFHDWSLQLKNDVLKEALEKGYFTIGDPGKGLSRLQVPINIFLASNNGIGLITARDKDGRRVGAPLDENQMMDRWQRFSQNKAALKEEVANPTPSNQEGGTSEEVLSRIPNSRLVLLRPLSKENLIKIAKMKLEKIKIKFLASKAMNFPSLKLRFNPKLVDFLANYDQLPEEGARSIDDKIKTLIEKPLVDSLFSKTLKVESGATLTLGVLPNGDGTYSLTANDKRLLMSYTEKGRDAQPISDLEIDRLNKLEGELNARVKGIPAIVQQLAKDIRRSSNTEKASHSDLETKTADVYMLLGTSSTGKTELAVALHQVLYSTPSKPLVIDFSQIQTIEDLKAKILGARDFKNQSIASDFMQEYDRRSGKMVVVLDEISNANPEILKALYDILREPVVQTFSDKKPRPMGHVKIVMTGNAGEEWYRGIPRDLPEPEQLDAARRVYDSAMASDGYRRKFLMSKFSEAFINRVGEHRIFFFGPHTSKTVRELIQLKLVKALQEFSKPAPGKRTWNLKFQSPQDYQRTIVAIEDYGFKLWEQGASISNFVQQVLMSEIHDQLLSNKIADRAEVIISKTEDKPGVDGTKVGFRLSIAGRSDPLLVEVKGKSVVRKIKQNANEILLTSFHEAGHEVVRHILLGDKIKSGGVSILPGVTEIDGQWVSYAGIARTEQIESYQITREMVVAQIAVLAGGEAGEQLTTKNARHTAGKANDIQRATALAKTAILRWGLSDSWGRSSLLEKQDIDQYLGSLSASKKVLFEKEIQSLLGEGRNLARKVIVANYEYLFNPIASHLAARGEISGPTLQRFYQQREHVAVYLGDEDKINKATRTFETKIKLESPSKNGRDFEFYSFLQQPKSIVNIDELRAQSRIKELVSVDLSPGLALVKTNSGMAKQSLVSNVSAKDETTNLLSGLKRTKTAGPLKCSQIFSGRN